MISLHAIEDGMAARAAGDMSPLGQTLASVVTEAERVSRILDVAEFLGWQDDGNGGRFQLWNLRKALGPHGKGSTITRATLERLLFGAGGKYGAVDLPTQTPPHIAAVESPNPANPSLG